MSFTIKGLLTATNKARAWTTFPRVSDRDWIHVVISEGRYTVNFTVTVRNNRPSQRKLEGQCPFISGSLWIFGSIENRRGHRSPLPFKKFFCLYLMCLIWYLLKEGIGIYIYSVRDKEMTVSMNKVSIN